MTLSRRNVSIAAVALAVPLVAFGVTRTVLDSEPVRPLAATAGTTTTSSTTVAETTTAPQTTTSAPPPAPTAVPAAGAGLPPVPRPGEPVAANDAAGLAAQIRTAEAALADPATPAADLARQAHIQQVAYRALVNRPELKAPTLGRLEGELRAVAEANVTAGAKLRSMLKAPKESLPAWRIVAPAPPEELLGYYRKAEAELGVPWQYLASIHLVETRMGRIRGTSDAGAQGPMQFMPATWRGYGNGGDINSNHDSILAAARLLKRNGAPGDMRNALFNYNRDNRYVDAVLAYADRMAQSPRAYFGYHQWQVYYVTVAGDVWLPEGWTGD